MGQLPAGSIEAFEDIYGWVYQGGRDLSGFIDGECTDLRLTVLTAVMTTLANDF